MQLEIRSTNIHFGDSVRDYITERVQSAIGHYQRWIGVITVHLADINGPHGGNDKQCRIAAQVRGGRTIHLEDTDADLIEVIDRATDRVKQTLGRELERRRTRKRRSGSRVDGTANTGELPPEPNSSAPGGRSTC